MVHQKSLRAPKLDLQLTEATEGVKSGVYQVSCQAAKALGLNKRAVT